MSQTSSPPALRQGVAGAILDGAAQVLAARGRDTSMGDVAIAAGVARATVYRHFPTRQVLLEELAQLAVREVGDRLGSARIDEVPVEEGVSHAVRALIEVGDPLAVLVRQAADADGDAFDDRVAAPLRRLIDAGQAGGHLRGDIESAWLVDVLIGLVVGVGPSRRGLGREDTVAALTSLFLHGARRPRPAAR